MKIRLLLMGVLVAALMSATTLVSAQSDATCNVASLFGGWAAATPAGAPNGVIYGYVANLSDQPDTLLSVSTDVAEAAELHQMMMGSGDVMQMMPVEGGLQIAPHDFQELKSGGYHIMLVNLKQGLVTGDSVKLTLQFEHAGKVEVTVPVVDAMQDAMGGMDMGSGMNMESTPEMSNMGGMSMEATPEMSMMMWPEACAKMQVVGAWARPAGPGMPNSAAYGLLLNLTGAEDTLISATTSAAGTVELHEMKMGDGDVMQMRPIEGGIVIPPDGAVILQPGGKHIMLIGLTQELKAGENLELTLTFVHNGVMKVTAPIHESPVTMPMSAMPQSSGG